MGDFNPRDNLRRLFTPPDRHHLATLDGLRAVSILWVLAFHCVFFVSTVDLDLALTLRNHPLLAWQKFGFRGVDIFFVISGFIISHILMREHKAAGRIGLRNFYLRRAIRLFPAYYVSLGLYGLLDPLPLKNVWANLLYVNNFLPITEQFMGWAWSLAIEEQFYIVFPVALILLLRLDARYRVAALVAVTLAAVALYGGLLAASACQVPPPFEAIDAPVFLCYFDTLYDKFHTRFGALLMGVTVAYLYNYTRAVPWLDANPSWRRLLLALALLALVPFTGFVETDGRGVFSTYFALNYFYLFALGIAYIILFTLTDGGKRSVVARFLSSRVWFPIAQLSYSAYLVHPTVILTIYLYVLTPTQVDAATALAVGVGLAVLCFAVAALLYLFVERPAMNARERYVAAVRLPARPQPERDPASA
jgi:peptidoglycan/LPS O-acetylase OafA/YrhL